MFGVTVSSDLTWNAQGHSMHLSYMTIHQLLSPSLDSKPYGPLVRICFRGTDKQPSKLMEIK